MRTLRKGLAMLLVVIMVLGLGAFTAVAAPSDTYADAGEISETYKEAVDVLTYIGVLEGDNGFRPQDTLTRAEGAKILTAVMGVLNPTGTATTFTDVDDWAKGYVAYVEVNGISDGVAENLFGSQMKLTGSMFSKWLLVGLGYDAETEGMTGIPWEINIAKLVRVTGLDAGLQDYDPTKEITREEAAQMALNALMTPMVEYDTRVTLNTTTDGTLSVSGKAGYVNNNTETGRNNIGNDNKIELGERYWKSLKLKDGNDKMGRPIREWTYVSTLIGSYVRKSAVVATWTKGVSPKNVYDTVGRTDYNALNVAQASQERVFMTARVDGGTPTQVSSDITIGNYLASNASPSLVPGTGNGVLTELYRVESGDTVEYTLVTMHTFLLKATADYNADNKSVKVTAYVGNDQNTIVGTLGITEIKQQDFDVSNVLKDEYLLVTAYTDGPGYKVQSVEPATVLTGEVESYTASRKDSAPYEVTSKVKIDGTEYSYNRVIGYANDEHQGNTEFSVGRNATVVLDQYGYIILVEEADAGFDARYVYISEAVYSLGLKAKAYFLDGTMKDISVKKVGTVTANTNHGTSGNGSYIGGKWWSYTTDDSGVYTLDLKTVKDARPLGADNANDVTYSAGGDNTVSYKDNVKFLRGDIPAGTDKTIMIVVDSGDISVFQGAANMPAISATQGTVTVRAITDNARTYTKYAFVSGTKLSVEGGARNEDLLFVLSATKGSGTDNKTGKYQQVDVVLNGEKKEKLLVDDDFYSSLTIGQLYTNLKYNDAGWLKDATLVGKTDKEYAGMGKSAAVDKITATSNTLKLGSVALNVSAQNANINLIINGNAGISGIAPTGINTNYLSTSATGLAQFISDKNYTGAYDYFVVYSAKPDSSHNGVAKAVYVYLRKGTASTATNVSDLMDELDANNVVDFDGSSGNITTGALTVDEGQVLNITGGTIKLTSLTNNGTINVAGGTLDVEGITVTNNGTVNVNSGTLKVDASTTWNENSPNSLHIKRGLSGTFGTLIVAGGAQVEIAQAGITITNLTVNATATVTATANVTFTTATVNGTLEVGNSSLVTISTLEGSGKIVSADNTEVGVEVSSNSSSVTSDIIGKGGTLTIDNAAGKYVSSTPAANAAYEISADASVDTITIKVDSDTAETLSASLATLQSSLTTVMNDFGAKATITVDTSTNEVIIKITTKATSQWSATLDLSAATIGNTDT